MLDTVDPLELIADPKLAKLLDVSLRSIARWDEADDGENKIPAPVVINGRKYRRRAEVEAWLRKRALIALAPQKTTSRKAPAKRPSEL